MSAWKPGYVCGNSRDQWGAIGAMGCGGEDVPDDGIRVEVGQQWTFVPEDGVAIRMGVVAISPLGEVVLRAGDHEAFEKQFPLIDVTVKGKTEKTRLGPFFWVSEEHAKAVKESVRKLNEQLKHQKDPERARAIERRLAEIPVYEPEDVAVHEAWDVWHSMHLVEPVERAGLIQEFLEL